MARLHLKTSGASKVALPIALATVATLPLIGASCVSNTVRIFRVGRDVTAILQGPTVSVSDLNQLAAEIDSLPNQVNLERNTPWRRGVAYESISQSIALLRHLAVRLGWSADAYRAKVPNLVTLAPEEAKLTLSEIEAKYDLNLVTEVEKAEFNQVMTRLQSIKQTAALNATQQLNAVLAIGDDDLSSARLDLASYYNVIIPSDLANQSGYKVALYPDLSLNAPSGQGILNVRVANTPYSRNLIVANLSPSYAILSDKLINDFAQWTPLLIERLVTYYNEYRNLFKDTFLPGDFIDMLTYFDTLIPQSHKSASMSEATIDDSEVALSAKWNSINWTEHLKALNYGKYHFLALQTFYHGLSAGFVTEAYQLYNRTVGGYAWSNQSLAGIDRMTKVPDLVVYATWPVINVAPSSAQYTYQGNLFDSNQSGYLAYFANQKTPADLLALNHVVVNTKVGNNA